MVLIWTPQVEKESLDVKSCSLINSLRSSDAYMRRKQANIGSDNGWAPGRRQVIIWTNTGILLTGNLESNFSEILNEVYTFSFKKMHLKMSSGK